MAITMCKYHGEKPVILRRDGRSTGLCQECLNERGRKAIAVRTAKKILNNK